MAYKQLKLWFDGALAQLLSDKIKAVNPQFKDTGFTSFIDEQVQDLELKARVELIADELYERLGSNYPNCINTLLQILGPENEAETGMFKIYYWVMPIAKIVEKYGLNEYELSIKAIEEITKRNTGEYTIRPFLTKETNRTLEVMLKWATDSNKHVRRLASEGVRPRLPWASKLEMFITDPSPIFPILDQLKDDPSKYVQKSVANCINDVLKDNLEAGKELIEGWTQTKVGKERKWIIKHALRNLIKVKDEWAIQQLDKV
ncbi:MAG: DNA alkylation repair protein [Bacteroidota bacterium]